MYESEKGGVASAIAGICCGALAAVAIGYTFCYVAAGLGLGVVGEHVRQVGPVVFQRAALNLYAMQHVTLIGHGRSAGYSGAGQDIYGTISVPLSLWAVVPALALMMGGFTAARLSRLSGVTARIVVAVLSGIVYAAVMAVGARFVSAGIDSFLMPELSGFGSNPPEFPFRPAAGSAFLFTGMFGVVFTYFGGVMATRRQRSQGSTGNWWSAVKAVILIATVIQLPIAGYLVFLDLSGDKEQETKSSGTTGLIELIPTVAGLGYSMIHGAHVTAQAASHLKLVNETRQVFRMQLGVYSGITRSDESEVSQKPVPRWVTAVAILLGGLGAFGMGRLAIRWGSRDGSLPTALRVALIHTAYLALLTAFCACSLVTKDAVSTSTVTVAPSYGLWLFFSFFGVLFLSLLGAWRFGTGTTVLR